MLIAVFGLARLYLAVDNPDDVLLGVALGVAVLVAVFRVTSPRMMIFPVVYRRGWDRPRRRRRSARRRDPDGRARRAGAGRARDQAARPGNRRPCECRCGCASRGPRRSTWSAKLYTKGDVPADRGRQAVAGPPATAPWKTSIPSRPCACSADRVRGLRPAAAARRRHPHRTAVRDRGDHPGTRVHDRHRAFRRRGRDRRRRHRRRRDRPRAASGQGGSGTPRIAHRYIKPGNLMVRRGHLPLIDVNVPVEGGGGLAGGCRRSTSANTARWSSRCGLLPLDRVYEAGAAALDPGRARRGRSPLPAGWPARPSLRVFMNRDPRDLLGMFLMLALSP